MNLIKIRNNSLSSGLRNGNRKFFRFTKWKLENLRFPFHKTELSRNSGLRNKFPDHSISKMEIFFQKNGNPTLHTLVLRKRTAYLMCVLYE